MKTIHVNEILPKRLERITTGSELLLVFEIKKYVSELLGAELSTDGITIVSLLEGCEHYSFVMSNGLTFGKVLSGEERANLKSYDPALYFSNKTVSGIVLKEETPELWVYERDFSTSNNFMHLAYRAHAYVSLVAYMLVISYRDGIKPRLLIDHENHAELEFEYVDLLILMNWGNKLLDGLVEIKTSKAKKYQPDWQAFLTLNMQRGFMNREYSRAEKLAYYKKFFKEGDVVLLYLRDLEAKNKVLGRLTSCYPAVIKGCENGVLTLNYYPVPQTKTTRQLDISNMIEMAEDEDNNIYSDEDFEKFPESSLSMDVMDIGMDKYTFTENVFIIKPIDNDGSYQYFKTEDGYRKEWLSTLDTIYAVFEDRGVEYDKERFLETYFNRKDRIPVYEQYRNEDF